MNTTLKAVLIVIGILVLAGGIFFAGSVYGWVSGFGPAMTFGYRSNQSGYGPGMMGGHGWNTTRNAGPATLTVDQAKAAADKYLANLNNADLKITEVMVFDNNAYVAVKENSTGIGAFELLVDPASEVAYPEYGPNMMWNVKYSGLNHQYMMGGRGGMMGGWGYQGNVPSNVPATMPVTKDQAIKNAQAYLDKNIAGATAADDPMQFYGYYTLDFETNGKVAGMLSVNGYSGQIFLHTWHGTFVQEAQVQ